jgi:predicted anti-sigma-YlaC factor YlaD
LLFTWQNLIARRMSEHLRDCDQCAEWWDWVWEEAGVPRSNTEEIVL